MIRRWHGAVALLAALLPGFGGVTANAAETLRIGGTGAALGTMERLAADLRKRDPSFTYEILPNLGSGGGLKALVKGAIQMAVISRPLKQEEHNADLVATEYGRSPFVIVTAKPGVSNIGLAQLVDLYADKGAKWPDGSSVRLVLRPRSDIDAELLASFSPEMNAALQSAMLREGMVVAATDRESADAVIRLPGAVGTSSLSLLLTENRRLTPLAINGVQPTVANLERGAYPYGKSMSVVVRKPLSPATEQFLKFLSSETGRRILVETGHALPKGTTGKAN